MTTRPTSSRSTPSTRRSAAASTCPASRRWCGCRSTSTAPTGARGLNTATFISGYRGSPLGGLDQTLERDAKLLARAPRRVLLGPQRGPGGHRGVRQPDGRASSRARSTTACSACGTARRRAWTAPATPSSTPTTRASGKNGGVLALAGDDPVSKSSTLPSHSEVALYDALMPDDLSRATCRRSSTWACTASCSRASSGLWVGDEDRHQRRRRGGHRRGRIRSA